MLLTSMLWISCTLLALWVVWRLKYRKLLAAAKTLPGPEPLPLIGNGLRFMCNPQEFIEEIRRLTVTYGDVTRFWLGPDLNIIVTDPDDLKILLTSSRTAVKGVQYKYMADVLGGGILSGSGLAIKSQPHQVRAWGSLSLTVRYEDLPYSYVRFPPDPPIRPSWRRHRKLANPNYGKRAIEGYSSTMNEEVNLLLDKLRPLANGEIMDIYAKIVQTTSYTVCRTLMGLTRDETMSIPFLHEVIETSPKMYDVVFDRMTKWWLQIDPIFWITDSNKFQKHFLNKMTEFSTSIVNFRTKALNGMGETKISDLMNNDEDSMINTRLSVIDRFILSNELTPDEMVRETFTIFTSSQEATAKISSFLLLMMAYHQDNQERLYQEIIGVLGDEDSMITDEHLKQMPYLEMVFKEVLRLFPIGAILQRSINEDIAITNAVLPAGSSLVIPIYHLQRDSRFWQNPEAFDPERFNPENTRQRHPYAYIPFSLGPMDCLGRHFGTKLVKTVCVEVLKNYKVSSLETYNDLKLAIVVSVTSLNGFNVKLTPRTM